MKAEQRTYCFLTSGEACFMRFPIFLAFLQSNVSKTDVKLGTFASLPQ